jgi:transcriptional regulator with XRE-family HTH domain
MPKLTEAELLARDAGRDLNAELLEAAAALLGVSPRTLQDWEQGRREPTGAAKTLLRVAERHPEVLRELAA